MQTGSSNGACVVVVDTTVVVGTDGEEVVDGTVVEGDSTTGAVVVAGSNGSVTTVPGVTPGVCGVVLVGTLGATVDVLAVDVVIVPRVVVVVNTVDVTGTRTAGERSSPKKGIAITIIKTNVKIPIAKGKLRTLLGSL